MHVSYSNIFELFEPHLDLYQSLMKLELQYDFLAFIASSFRVTEED